MDGEEPVQELPNEIHLHTRECLTEYELAAIEGKEFSISRLSIVRDIFVFCCYTGLSHIDILNLGEENIVHGIDSRKWISFKRHKTNQAFQVSLLPKALEIIEKYSDHPTLNEGAVLPVFSNQKTNSYLKEIADLCGIKKNLPFHLARHTFVTTVTLSNGVPIESVSFEYHYCHRRLFPPLW
jgi:integrase